MTLEDKIHRARSIAEKALGLYKRPAFMCSFGKDSMVLLHLLRSWGHSLPIVFYTDPWFPKKYAFARQVINDWELEVHDYPPAAVTLWEGKEIMAFTNHYQIGPLPHSVLQLPKNILPPEPNRKYLCGLREVLARPTGTYAYPWDLVFIGHKSSDQDQIAGKVTLHCDVKQNAGQGPDAAFPLREWTDADVWAYTEKFGVPQQWDRYDRTTKQESPDKHSNSDYAHVCIACCDRREKRVAVPCPKLGGMEVTNVSALVRYSEPNLNYYGDAPR